jgi:GT2 family glycosyltransferase
MILCIPTLNRFRELHSCVKSAYDGTVVPEGVIIFDNSGGRLELDESIKDLCTVYRSPTNLGCAISWNFMLDVVQREHPNSHALVSNDDIHFSEHTIELFQKAIENEPEEIIYATGGIQEINAFSLFVTTYNKLNQTVGLFDEFFVYPYCEDTDMAVRLWKAGYTINKINGCTADHLGSATLKAYDEIETRQHHIRFQRNAEYFNAKWGISHTEAHERWMNAIEADSQSLNVIKRYIVQKYGY